MPQRFDHRARTLVAQEAARLIVDEGVVDYRLAKQKALDRLGLCDRAALPRNVEIEEAIREYRELFFTQEDRKREEDLWRAALEAMRFLQPFEPKLVGPVLHGTSGRHAMINLHIFSDAVEEVLFHFMDAGVAYGDGEKKLRFGKSYTPCPCLYFESAGIEVESIVLPTVFERQPPLSAVDGRPMRRAELKIVAAHLESLGSLES